MQVKLFYKTQRELAMSLNIVMDAYWENEINEETLINRINEIYNNNPRKVLKAGEFTSVLKQQCGKRRLDVIERILKSSADGR
ncbi:glycosyl transferase [Bacillus sp. BA3]|uniref:TIGR04540 family protein n=1 Tax=Bacillus sp. BA3 TaxID=2057910 RepID=UPI000C33125F|nr:TIGR04540 family protein [Bacillus sp. BA3]PKF86737.1 glycosyl transferase [Bacillus sp. BA3]